MNLTFSGRLFAGSPQEISWQLYSCTRQMSSEILREIPAQATENLITRSNLNQL